MCKVPLAVLRHDTAVLDAHTELVFDIDAGFNGNRHAFFEYRIAGDGSSRFLMDQKTEAVTERMTEAVAVSLLGDIVACDRIQFFSGDTRFSASSARVCASRTML